MLLAYRNLFAHVDSVVDNLYSTSLCLSKQKLSALVSRKLIGFGECETCEVCILSLIENFGDAVLLPIVYYVFGGLPSLMVFKLVDLADSLLGNFDCANKPIALYIAKLDDVLSGMPFVVTSSLWLFFVKLQKAQIVLPKLLKQAKVLILRASASCLKRSLNTSGAYNSSAVKDENLSLRFCKPDGVSIKCCETLVCVVCLLILI